MKPNPTDRRKILVIDFLYPLPETIGRNMRTMNFVRFFREYGSVDLLYFYPKPDDAGTAGVFRKEFFIRHPSGEGYRENRWHQKIAGRTERLLRKRPWMITEWSSRDIETYISIIRDGGYDLVFCRYILDTVPLFRLPENLRKRVVIDYDDVFSQSLYGFIAKYDSNPLSRMKDRFQKHLLVNYEKKCLRFGAALFVTRHDLKNVAGDGGLPNAHVVPNIFPCGIAAGNGLGNGYPKRNRFLFIGTLDYGPNVEGLKWFVDSVFRKVAGRVENARLLVVGRAPTSEVKALCDSVPDIELHPDVPDVLPFYRDCGIVVVPILAGGGTRIKILEAGMVGRPVLATPMGANGLDVTDGKDLFLFTDGSTFLESCNRLNDRNVYDSVAGSMKSLVENLYSPEAFNRKMTEVLRSLPS
ncbi:MAG: hypothetical protein C3F14_10610 [Deltaproteobacteria bacterium]|nr:MAG: hypothetical protein C3F14_10610 [Deltaproteobacteria bacterium]